MDKNKLTTDNIEDSMNDFFDKLVFAVNQPSGKALVQKIIKVIGDNFDIINESIYVKLHNYMSEWTLNRTKIAGQKGAGHADALTHEDVKTFLSDAKGEVSSLSHISLTLLYKTEIEQKDLGFKDEAIQNISDFISDKKGILVMHTNSGLLSEIKVYQILVKLETNKYIISDQKSLKPLMESHADPVIAFSSAKTDYLIITFISIDDDELFKKLYEVVKAKPQKKLILIVEQQQNLNIEKHFMKEHVSTIVDDSHKLDDLTLQSRDRILKKEITVFGKVRNLGSLAEDKKSMKNLCLGIYGDALTALITLKEQYIEIGSHHYYGFEKYIDIPRTFKYRTMLNDKCLKEINHEIFAIVGIEECDLAQLIPKDQTIRKFTDKDPDKENPIRFIILDDRRAVNDFDKLTSEYNSFTIHLLEYNERKQLEWKDTHGSLFNLRRFLRKEEYHEKNLSELKNIAIVSGEPGLGKTTLLTTYATKSNSIWTISIRLKDYETQIVETNFRTLNRTIKFLTEVIDPQNLHLILIENLLKFSLKQEHQVSILLDGYDEVKERTQDKVVQLMKTLKKTKAKVLLSTRVYAQTKLEDALGLFSYSLNPFDKNEQIKFLTQFWSKGQSAKACQETKIIKFAEHLLNYLNRLNLMQTESIVGIVLQARMVAELFEERCKSYIKDGKINLSRFKINDISQLYERFIVQQFERFFKEKLEIDSKLSNGLKNVLAGSFLKEHGCLALQSLFDSDQVDKLLSNEPLLDEDLLEIGLVKLISGDGETADFVHITYAEFFAADRLVNAIGKLEDNPKYKAVYTFLLNEIFRDSNRVIQLFIDMKIKNLNDENLNDENLKTNWNAILDCSLLEGAERDVKLHLSKPPLLDLSTKILNQMAEDVKNINMNWIGGKYYYNKDKYVERIEELFRKFSVETDIDALRSTLVFIMTAYDKSYYHWANDMVSSNVSAAITHYFQRVKKLRKNEDTSYIDDIYDQFKNLIDKDVLKTIQKLKTAENKEHLIELTDLLIPAEIKTVESLIKLNLAHQFIDVFFSDIMKPVKLFIRSSKGNKEKYTMRIINSINAISTNYSLGKINKKLGYTRVPFFVEFLHHKSVIDYAKSYINDVFKSKSNIMWLERQGILMCRIFEILTPEMSKNFNYILEGLLDGGSYIYSEAIFGDLIHYFVGSIIADTLPHVNKQAFLKMIVRFVGFYVDLNCEFPFTTDQLEQSLKIVSVLLHEKPDVSVVPDCVEYLIVLRKAGLKLIYTDEHLLVMDPGGDFEYNLNIDYLDEIVLLIKWKNKHGSATAEQFLKKCSDFVACQTVDLKRKHSESKSGGEQEKKIKN